MSEPQRVVLDRVNEPGPETQAFLTRIREVMANLPPAGSVPLEQMRRLRAEGKGVLPNSGPLAEAEWRAFDPAALGVPEAAAGPCRLRVMGEQTAPRAIVVYIHGGGWTFGSPEQFDGRTLGLAQAVGGMGVSVAYRLGPEHVWPACADDALAGVLWALEEARRLGGASGPLPVFLTGDSAGGHLSAVTMLRLRALGRLSEIRAAALIYGCFDLTMTPSMRNWGETPLILSTPLVEWFVGNLLGERGEALEAKARGMGADLSPLLADLRDMPPSLFQVGDADPLLDDSLFMAERWRAAGAQAELLIWPGGVHGFDYFVRPEDALPIAVESHKATAAYFQRFL